MLGEYTIKNELTEEQLEQLLALSQQMWWSKDRTMDEIKTMLKHCIPFAVIENKTQRLVGFARVLTDEVRYAYIYDVMIVDSLRGKGLGKMIMRTMCSHATLNHIKYFELTCTHEMVDYYRKFEFYNDLGSVVALRKTRKS